MADLLLTAAVWFAIGFIVQVAAGLLIYGVPRHWLGRREPPG